MPGILKNENWAKQKEPDDMNRVYCEMCGVTCSFALFAADEEESFLLCPFCRAEQQSCGCSDEMN